MPRKRRKRHGLRRFVLPSMAIAGVAALAVAAFVIVGDRGADGPQATLSELNARAAAGDAEAQLQLGILYSSGSTGIGAQPATAFQWFQKAAERGSAEAQEALGRMLLHGIGVPADTAAAMAWYEKAALQGRAESQGRLGNFYHDGISVPQDFSRALEWYGKAAAQGHGESMYNLGIMNAEGQGIKTDFLAAGEWFRKAATHGYGFGIPEQYQEVVAWAEDVEKNRPAADRGDPEAQYRLASLFFGPEPRARNVPQNREAAIKLYHSAAAKGHALAMYALGLIYQGKISHETANGTDYVQAHMWYNLAASRLAPGDERDQAVKDRDFLARYRLSADQLAEAQRLARAWKPAL